MDGRAGEPAVPAVLAILDPLRAGDANRADPNDPEGIDGRSGLERALDVRGQVEDKRKGVQTETEEKRGHRAARLALRQSPHRRECSRGRCDVHERVEHGDGRRLRVAADIGRECRREVHGHRGPQRDHDRADIEDQGVEREALIVPAKQQHECDGPDRRGGHEAQIRDERRGHPQAADLCGVTQKLTGEPGDRARAEEQPHHAVVVARRADGTSGAEDRADGGAGPGEVGNRTASEVVGQDLLDPVNDGRADDRRGIPRHCATRVRREQFSYHGEDARDRDRATERPERTDRGLRGGRERGNSRAHLPHWCEYCDAWASFIW